MDKIAALRHAPRFAALSDDSIQALAETARVAEVQRGEIVVQQDSNNDSLYVLLSGEVRVFRSEASGKEMVLSREGPGAIFGEISVIDLDVRSASVVAVEKTKMLVINGSTFRKLLEQNSAFSMSILVSLAHRVRKLTDAAHGLALRSAYRRMSAKLYEEAELQGEHWIVKKRMTHQLMADMIGCSREMVSRMMSDLLRGGYIRVEGRHWIIVKKLPADY
jgi:CRP/FNR family cyclic AMP-dependent transcriptional regulator